MLHTLLAQPDRSEPELAAALDRVWPQLPFDSPWYSANERARHHAMIQAFCRWREKTRHELTEVGVEVGVEGVVETPMAAGSGCAGGLTAWSEMVPGAWSSST